MTWYWYEEQPRELFVDLDNANPSRVMAFSCRLRGGMVSGKLPVERYLITPSAGEHGLHVVILLEEPMPAIAKAAWSLYLLSDRFRTAINLARTAQGDAWPSVLIEPVQVPRNQWREEDAFCMCPEKHTPEVTALCPVAQGIGRREAAHYFGTPDTDHWKDTLLSGVLRPR